MKRMVKMVAVLCVVGLMAVAGVASADNGEWNGGHAGKHQRHDFRKLAKKLNLSQAQRAQAKSIFEANRAVIKPTLESLRAEHKNLQALIHADTVDEAAIRAQTAKVAGIQADLNVNRAKTSAQFRAILTPAQQATLKAMQEKRQQKGAPQEIPAP